MVLGQASQYVRVIIDSCQCKETVCQEKVRVQVVAVFEHERERYKLLFKVDPRQEYAYVVLIHSKNNVEVLDVVNTEQEARMLLSNSLKTDLHDQNMTWYTKELVIPF